MPTRRVRLCYFNTWAKELEEAASYIARVPTIDLTKLVTIPQDPVLLAKARLDCDWYGENTRCFAAVTHPDIEFLPAWVCGREGVLDLARVPREAGEERWLVTMGQQPEQLGPMAPKVFTFLAKVGVRHLFYAFDEASRTMPCFGAIAPYLDVLIHDEAPLAPAPLRADCVTLHRSWVANLVPFAAPFCAEPEERIVFLGSQLGLTPHRQRQVAYLRERFGDRFFAISDHSLSVADRVSLASRAKVSVCPEGRKFATPAMAQTHTDRPFWSGCLGLVPVSEDSAKGGRLEELHRANLIRRYPHDDLAALGEACERALAATAEERRRIYDHFNSHETIGPVAIAAVAQTQPFHP